MPILEIEIILKPNETIRKEMASALADQLGDILASPKGGTWVKVRGLPAEQYKENGGKTDSIFPIFVSVLKSE